jgi:hypothetical protein
VNQGIAAGVLSNVSLMMFQFLAQAYRLPNHKCRRRLDGGAANILGNRAYR